MADLRDWDVTAAIDNADRYALSAVDRSPGVLVHAAGPALHCSRSLLTLLGHNDLPPEAAQSVLALIPSDVRDVELTFYRRCLTGDGPGGVRRVKRLRSDGSIRWLDQQVDRIAWHDGSALFEFLLPIEPTSGEADGSEHANRLQAAVEAMPNGVLLLDPELRIEGFNSEYLNLWSYPPGLVEPGCPVEVTLRYNWERGDYGACDAETKIAEVRSRFLVRGTVNSERLVPDGRVFDIRVAPRADGGYVVTQVDITERKRAADEFRLAKERAEQALAELSAAQHLLIAKEKLATLGMITAGIAHEIKNPLNFINNFASLSADMLDELAEEIAAGRLDEIRRIMPILARNLRAIGDHGKRLDGIVQGTLLHSRGTGGARQPTNVHQLVDQAVNLVYRGSEGVPAIAIERDILPEPFLFDLVPQDMLRVLVNLLSNALYAVKHRLCEQEPSYRPQIAITARRPDDRLEIRVRDNGRGLSPSARDQLFTPFFTTKPAGEGTGLGLSLSYDIVVHQHGGTLTVASIEGAFAEFIIRVPAEAGGQPTDRP